MNPPFFRPGIVGKLIKIAAIHGPPYFLKEIQRTTNLILASERWKDTKWRGSKSTANPCRAKRCFSMGAGTARFRIREVALIGDKQREGTAGC